MMKLSVRRAVIAVLLAAVPAAAWGPKTEVAIVVTAAQLLSRGGAVSLQKTMPDLQRGASVSREQLLEMYPDLDINPINVIEQEMRLLSTVRGDRIDPYFVYRLGTLGKVVAGVVAPMQNSSATYRNLYYSDVDGIIETISLEPGSRDEVDVQSYFQRVLAEAAVNDAVIEREYESGAGFSEVARSTVRRDTSRAVDAVADVMHTIVTGRASAGGVSESQLQRYILSAYEYYIRRGNELEIAAAAERLNGLAPMTPQMHQRIGDMFFSAGMKERAMTEYRQVVATAPDRNEVMEKMAQYYIEQGQAALEEERFTAALESFRQALEANPLNPEAERFRLQAEAAMQDKEARQAAAQAALVRASELVTLAEQEAVQGLYAEASALLQQALDAYAEVGDEFPAETQERLRGEDQVRARMREYKQDLVANARQFSGSGYARDVQELAATGAPELDARALQELLEREYAQRLQQLEAQLQTPDAQ